MNEETRLIDPAQDNENTALAPVEEVVSQETTTNKNKRFAALAAGFAASSAIGVGAATAASYLLDSNEEAEVPTETEVQPETPVQPTVHHETVVHHVYDRAPQPVDTDKIPEDAVITNGYIGPDDKPKPPIEEEGPRLRVVDVREGTFEGEPAIAIIVEDKETGEQAMLIDVGPNGTIDIVVSDENSDGEIDWNSEAHVVTSEGIPTQTFIDLYNEDHKDMQPEGDSETDIVPLVDVDPEDDDDVEVVDVTEGHNPNDIATPVTVEESDVADQPVAVESEVEVEPEVIGEPMAYEEPVTYEEPAPVAYEEPEVYREEPTYDPVQTEDYASAEPMPDYNPNADTGLLEA